MLHEAVYTAMELHRELLAYMKRLKMVEPRFPGEMLDLCHSLSEDCGKIHNTRQPPGGTLISTRVAKMHVERLCKNAPTKWRVGAGIRLDVSGGFHDYLEGISGVMKALGGALGQGASNGHGPNAAVKSVLLTFYETVGEFADSMASEAPKPFNRRKHIAMIEEAGATLGIAGPDPIPATPIRPPAPKKSITGPLPKIVEDSREESISSWIPDVNTPMPAEAKAPSMPPAAKPAPPPQPAPPARIASPPEAPVPHSSKHVAPGTTKERHHAHGPVHDYSSSPIGRFADMMANNDQDDGDLEATVHEQDLQKKVREELARDRQKQLTHPSNHKAPPIVPRSIREAQKDLTYVGKGVFLKTGPEPGSQLEGKMLGRYHLEALIGRGASAYVYRANHPKLHVRVAVKILHQPPNKAEQARLDLFLREARLSARINHPNAVRIFDLDEAEGLHFIVMEFVEGATAKAVLEDKGPYDEKTALEMALASASVLDAAFDLRIIHRDIKPHNIIITENGQVKVSDLGLAKIASFDGTETAIVGTPLYIAPEAIRDPTRVDFRADIYSLGATLYHLVTGRPPFDGNTMHELFEAHLNHFLVDPRNRRKDLSPGISALIMHMMEKRAEKRHANYRALMEEVRSLLDSYSLLRDGGRGRQNTSIVERFKSLLRK